MLRLVPVIELYPGRFGLHVPVRRNDEGFRPHWLRALAHAGVTGVEPHGAWHAALDDLTTTVAMELAVDVHFDRFRSAFVPEHYQQGSAYDAVGEASAAEVGDHVGALDGGYELTLDGEVLSFPGCCGDLGNIASWQDATSAISDEPAMLWIGHPWQTFRSYDGVLELHGPSEGDAAPVIARLHPSELRGAIRDASDAVCRFAERLAPVVHHRFGAAKAPEIVRRMIGR